MASTGFDSRLRHVDVPTAYYQAGGREVFSSLSALDENHLATADPGPDVRQWRTHQGQHPIDYWSATDHAELACASRLEASRAMLADFDQHVRRIVPQAVVVKVPGEHASVVDLLLVSDQGECRFVNIKPLNQQARPKYMTSFPAITRALATVGMEHEVWSGTDPTLIANIDAVSPTRRRHLNLGLPFDECQEIDGLTLEAAGAVLRDRYGDLAPTRVLSALWRHELTIDWTQPLDSTSFVRAVTS